MQYYCSALPIVLFLSCSWSIFMKIPNFDVFFRNFAPFCYDVTMKLIAILDNYSGFANEGTDLKIVLLSWKLHQSKHNRPFSYSTKEPGSSDIFIQFYSQGSIELR